MGQRGGRKNRQKRNRNNGTNWFHTGRNSSNNSRSDALEISKSDALQRSKELSGGPQKWKSIVFVIGSIREDGKDKCYKVSHDEAGTPTLSKLFETDHCTLDPFEYEAPFQYELVGSKMYCFRSCSHENISYVDLSVDHKWVKTEFKPPETTGDELLISGVFKRWLYLIGFFPLITSDGTSVWGQVYHVSEEDVIDSIEFTVDHPSSPPLSDPRVLGPWKDGLAVYTLQDNTLRVHNPENNKWKILAANIVEMELRECTVCLCGDIFYALHDHNRVLEAYNIAEERHLPRVQFHEEKDFPVFLPFVHLLSDGVLCFSSYEYGRFLYSRFFIDYGPFDEKKDSFKPEPHSTMHMNFRVRKGRLSFISTFDLDFKTTPIKSETTTPPKLETTT